MSGAAQHGFDPALTALLDSDRVPPLRADFAERVVAAATGAATASVPRLRPAAGRWRSMPRRLAIVVVGAGLLASAAAASGLLERIGIDLPPIERLWTAAPPKHIDTRPARVAPPLASSQTDTAAPLAGPIDTVETFDRAVATVAKRRIEARDTRRAERDARIEQRVDAVIARRTAQGLPVPSDAERARLRAQLLQLRAERDARRDAARTKAESELRQRIEAGGTVSPEEVIRSEVDPTGAGQRLRALSPQERRERLREAIARRRAASDAPAPTETAADTPGQ